MKLLGYGYIRDDPTMQKLAAKYGISPAQVSLAWHVTRGTTAVPKSTNVDRQRANLLVSTYILQAWMSD